MTNGVLKPLLIVLTACGCPGASTLIKNLKRNGEREIKIIGTDMDKEAVGRFLCDKFYHVPAGDSPDYIPFVNDILRREKPDILFPESSNEVPYLAKAKEELEANGTKVLVSSPEAITIASNKYAMYETLKAKGAKIDLPKYESASTHEEFHEAIELLGYPDNPVVFKPHIGKGSRGVRIIDPNADRYKKEIFNNSQYIRVNNMGFDEWVEYVNQ